jgi:hypothetical protein
MSFTFTMQSSTGVPAGAYTGVFKGFEPCETSKGAALRWSWEVTSGPHAGQTATCLTDPSKPTPRNKLGRLLTAMAGGKLGDGESFDPTTVVGKAYTVIVTPGSGGGGTRVETVAPLAS